MSALSVSSFSELKTAIEDADTTEISVQSDIVFNGGIKVNLSKSSLVIDFNNHLVTDNNNLDFTDTIYVASSTNTIHVTVKNAIWSGRNYYGVVGVYNGNVNTTIEFININYTGPQFAYNKNGITKINNCTIKLEKNESTTNPQEMCEGNRIFISGIVDVVSGSQSDALIWFTGTNAALTVEENAVFTVNVSSSYFLYTDVSPIMLFKQNSSTKVITKSGLFYAAGSSTHIASTFTLEEGASFVGYKQVSNSIPLFKCRTNFTLKNNSTFRLYSEVISSTALMYFGDTATINIDSPKSVVLYNRGGSVFSFQTGSSSKPNTININAEMVRMWNIATSPLSSAGGFSDNPTTEYFKAGYNENVTINAQTTTSQVLSCENNLIEGDSGYPITTSTYKILTSNVVAIGNVTLDIDEITDQSKTITGLTNPSGNIKIDFDGTSNTFAALENGKFDFTLESNISVGTKIEISANQEFLTKVKTYTSVGSLTISGLTQLNFYNFTTNSNQSIIFREDPNWNLVVTDTRTSGGEWYLYAHILNPLTSNDDKLENALIFKENGNVLNLSQTPILVFTGKWSENSKTTTISWKNLEGFLLQIDSDKTYNKGDYQTEILWQISTTLI